MFKFDAVGDGKLIDAQDDVHLRFLRRLDTGPNSAETAAHRMETMRIYLNSPDHKCAYCDTSRCDLISCADDDFLGAQSVIHTIGRRQARARHERRVDIAKRWRAAIRIWDGVEDAKNGYVSRIAQGKVKDIPGLSWRDFRGCAGLRCLL